MANEQLELFPTEVNYEPSPIQELQPQGSVELTQPKTIEDTEWCFQFFNNEPIVFGWQQENQKPTPLILQVQPEENQGLTFRHNGMEFKIFPRHITEETKKLRAEQNASKNKETTSESSNS